MARLPFIHKAVAKLTLDQIEKMTGLAIHDPNQFALYEHVAEINLGDQHITIPMMIAKESQGVMGLVWNGQLVLDRLSGVSQVYFVADMDVFGKRGTLTIDNAAIPLLKQQLNS